MSGPDDATVPAKPPRDSSERMPPSAPVRPERLPERYQLHEQIGCGGMGRVYRAHDTTLGRDVAVKVLESSAGTTGGTQPRDRFVREARAAARLAHPNIVAVHDADPEAGWLVMDLIEGESLRDFAMRGAMPAREVRAIADQVLAALDAAHASGVIHRDIKPSNIIVDARGKVTLVDFGVARLVDAEVTRTGESLGTPAYMAPEQLRGGKVDERTDLYGLAATLYELVSGERMVAFESPSPAAMAKVKTACGAERGLAQLIARCLQAAPEARIGSAREARVLIEPRASRRKWIVAAIAIVALAVGALVAWRAVARRSTEDPRKAELFAMAQGGQHQKALLLLQQYVVEHPDDADAWMMLMLTQWWDIGRLDEPIPNIDKLRPMQREMLHGIAMIANRKELGAVAVLEDAQRRYPESVEIEYALGEARWHGQQYERGVATLERAFDRDPRWLQALHHVLEFRLSRGETKALAPIANRLRDVDPPRAALVDCQIAIADRRHRDAEKLASTALAQGRMLPETIVCLMEAQILLGDLAGAEQTAKQAHERWPIDLRWWGGRTVAAELMLYRGKLQEYLQTAPDPADRQRRITLALWRPTEKDLAEILVTADTFRGPPIVPMAQVLAEHVLGRDATVVYEQAPELELRAYGRGLSAELRGDWPAAATEYRRALELPMKGDARMLIAYQLAKVSVAAGDREAAKAACVDVIAPRMYQAYRAALLPDCVLWSDDPVRWRELADAWTGEHPHPAVVEIRRRLAAK